MSKYQSLVTTIEMVEAIRKSMGMNAYDECAPNDILGDLREIAKDARYGGQWDGDFETVAKDLDYCVMAGTNCALCSYKKEIACRSMLKKDAAAAIRTMAKIIMDLEKEQKQE